MLTEGEITVLRDRTDELMVEDVDLKESSIAVWGKGTKQRKVCSGPHAQVLLEKYLDVHRPTDGLLGLKPRAVAKVLARQS